MYKYIIAAFLFISAYACSKADLQPIGAKSDQALVQDIVVSDTTQNDVSASKSVPKIVTDPVTNVEKLASPNDPLQIIVTLKPGTDIKNLNVRFVMSSQSKYAKVSPVLGHMGDYTNGGTYTVTSQSGKNVNVYTLVIKGS
ncbi:hypothetical protein [Chitinophaga sp. Cy-1792]|uniref:hypothetical protein n=1 Tax=Chitinophaga sp. Cy-1792 TaxID=2608339 RepID=UPI0014249753|nr:hypothetical protein [Chitinophaga sp. Cy-1792]NIG57347.1 hypothetical protein [Chitinophaga sp. Cy-1792]